MIDHAAKWKPQLAYAQQAVAAEFYGNAKVGKLGLNAIICNGGLLLTGVSGMGKTVFALILQKLIENATAGRIQFMEGIKPSDILGFRDWDRKQEEYYAAWAEDIFRTVVLFDEINRCNPKGQNALLQALAEGIITLPGGYTRKMSEVYIPIATRNLIVDEGTYPLIPALLDRFILETGVQYPARSEQIKLQRNMKLRRGFVSTRPCFNLADIKDMREFTDQMVENAPDAVHDYVAAVTELTRPGNTGFKSVKFRFTAEELDQRPELEQWQGQPLTDFVATGASPRTAQGLVNAACANALLDGRNQPTIADVDEVLVPATAHRIMMQQSAQFDGITAADVVIAAKRHNSY